MHAKFLLVVGAVLALTGPALSAQFFIVQDATTKRCSVVEQAPAENAGILLGDGAYGDRPSAEADMGKIGACQPQTAGSGAASGATPADTTATTPSR